jgi:leader peptidase (prepilin peptidase) / N-methyltransferase
LPTDWLAGSPALFVGACLVAGLLVGSFLNVVVYRLPVMLDRQWRAQCEELAGRDPAQLDRFNLLVPRSACPACKAPIRAHQNVPVVSWLLLRGRCAACGTRISARYPVVEALTGLASALVAWKYGYGWHSLAALVVTWFLIALTFIDLDTQLLPDDLTLPLLWLGLAASLWGPVEGVPLPVDTRSAIVGALAGYLSLWSVYHLFRLATGKEGMGYGDFKLLGALGAWLGWTSLLPIVLLSAAVGAVAGIAILASRGQDRSTPIPFGPFLASAGWLLVVFGEDLKTRLPWFFPFG